MSNDSTIEDVETTLSEAQRALRAAECEARAIGRSAAANLIKYASAWCDRARSQLYPPHAADPVAPLTAAEEKLLASADSNGHAWYWPAQSRMVQRLATRGMLTIDEVVRGKSGTRQRRVSVHPLRLYPAKAVR